MLQAASFGVHALTPSQFAEFIRRATRWGEATPDRIQRLVVTLGPGCFITTNYDQLLEEALRQAHAGRAFRVVTNAQVVELADIVQATAVDFVFKPHGDVADSSSIILSREQYRALHEQKAATLHAMTTLLVSRPVIYLGFGLRDPDFFFVKGIIARTYKGGARDHYAIVPDSPPVY